MIIIWILKINEFILFFMNAINITNYQFIIQAINLGYFLLTTAQFWVLLLFMIIQLLILNCFDQV